MKIDVDQHILHMNFVTYLVSYLERKTDFPSIMKMSEIIYARDHKTLLQPLLTATKRLHTLKEQMDRGEAIDEETKIGFINEIVLDLTDMPNIK